MSPDVGHALITGLHGHVCSGLALYQCPCTYWPQLLPPAPTTMHMPMTSPCSYMNAGQQPKPLQLRRCPWPNVTPVPGLHCCTCAQLAHAACCRPNSLHWPPVPCTTCSEEKKEVECLFKEMMAEYFPNLRKHMDIWIHEVQRLPIRFNPKTSLRYNITVKNQRQRNS